MTTADMIKQLCEQMNISIAELARRIGQTPQNFNKKLKRETITLDELKAIADVFNIKFEQTFILPDGSKIKTGNEQRRRPNMIINSESHYCEHLKGKTEEQVMTAIHGLN